MRDPILTPEQVDQVYENASEDNYHDAGEIARLCDSHESLRELAGRLARALEGCKREAAIASMADHYPESGTPFNVARDCANNIGGIAGALLATPAVQSLIAASKEAADGN